MQNFVRSILLACVVFASIGCAGPAKPKPSGLPPMANGIHFQRMWDLGTGFVGFPLDVKLVGSALYLASSAGRIFQIDAATGKVGWSHDLGVGISAGVGSDGDRVAVITQSGELAVVSRAGLLWQQKLGSASTTPPLVAGERVFTITPNGVLSAFDFTTGRKLWQQQQRNSSTLVLDHAGVLFPLGNTLVVGVGGRVLGINPLTGAQRWDVPIAVSRGVNEVERLVDLLAGVSRNAGDVCLRAYLTGITCMDMQKPSIRWSKAAKGYTGLAGDGQFLFGTEADGQVIALRRLDGERVWSNDSFIWRNLGAPFAGMDYLIIPDNDGLLHLLSKSTGQVMGRIALDGSPVVTVVGLSKKNIIAVTKKGTVYAYRPE